MGTLKNFKHIDLSSKNAVFKKHKNGLFCPHYFVIGCSIDTEFEKMVIVNKEKVNMWEWLVWKKSNQSIYLY